MNSKKENLKICEGIQELLGSIKEKDISKDTKEILFAEVYCFTTLYDALQSRKPDFEKLAVAKKTFEKLGFNTSVIAVNSLDTIIRVLSKHRNIEDVSESIQDSLLNELKNLYVLAGVLTEKIPIRKEYYTSKSTNRGEKPEIVYQFIENTEKDIVRVCLVQLDFSLKSKNERRKEILSRKKIFVFQTRCGVFSVLICIDYLKEAHNILYNPNENIRNVDFIVVPAYNGNKRRFQEKGQVDCQEGNFPHILQVNSWKIQDKEVGGTCVIGIEHKCALQRYRNIGLKTDDTIEYTLIEPQGESMIIVDLDIKRKGVPVPASGPKMRVFQKYVYENGIWNITGW